jgi:hypothetical protein
MHGWLCVRKRQTASLTKPGGMRVQYEDFDVSIEALTGRVYCVAVLQSPAGEAQESVEFPLSFIPIQVPIF